ncbi:DUF938 domain-containing protein [Aliidiomarina maris]|uniref:Methylase n=1 Tax=Aliidiomarina maris TaxID=531312 RepID=A0A327WYQ3_9GAMM|nr:DUF938 domain-containing protein [Aliidiomarina maris]RAJ94892.1 uncharacterized protein DUF938 [Aliidiomarina maris]RUO20507.1 methylase [Aliidiomarina maris]
MPLPYSHACENNKDPILQVLKEILQPGQKVLEIGAGTGQHAEYFAAQLPEIEWQASDRAEHLDGLQRRFAQAGLSNLADPIELDINRQQLPRCQFDLVYTANTLHIMSWPTVERLFNGLRKVLADNGKLIIYGPFNYAGTYTSGSNELFDQSLRSRNAHMGIRDIEKVQRLADQAGFNCLQDYQMPANNRLLYFFAR